MTTQKEDINLDANDNQQEPPADTSSETDEKSEILPETDEKSEILPSEPKTKPETDDDIFQKKALLKEVDKIELSLYRTMSMLRYKYEYYEFQNLVINVIIILCSSVITFLESLRANLAQDDDVDFWFTIITLSLGFVIAFSLSLFKFLKIQDKMEIIQSGLLGLLGPYKEICEFRNKVKGYWNLQQLKQKNDKIEREQDDDFINDKEVSQEWKTIKIKAVHPLAHANNIISNGEYYIYDKKFREQRLKTKKMQDKITLRLEAQENLKYAKGIILNDMLKPTSELYEKYGPVDDMKMANNIRLEYWNEGVIMSNNMQNKYNKVLGIKTYDKCFDNCVDVYCCFCNSWCKKFFKSIIYFFMCCCPRCCSTKDKRKHEWERREEREEREAKEEREEIV
tara:strand:- start:1981 stop:3168 length:1188 start_codon:yes stop_codon:yes gene_type:complete